MLYIETSHSLVMYKDICIFIKDISISAPKYIVFTFPA